MAGSSHISFRLTIRPARVTRILDHRQRYPQILFASLWTTFSYPCQVVDTAAVSSCGSCVSMSHRYVVLHAGKLAWQGRRTRRGASTPSCPHNLGTRLWTTCAHPCQVTDATGLSACGSAAGSLRHIVFRMPGALPALIQIIVTAPPPCAAATPASHTTRSTRKLRSSRRSRTTPASCSQSDPSRVPP